MNSVYKSLLLITYKDVSSVNKFSLFSYLINVRVNDSFIKIRLSKITKKRRGYDDLSFFRTKAEYRVSKKFHFFLQLHLN